MTTKKFTKLLFCQSKPTAFLSFSSLLLISSLRVDFQCRMIFVRMCIKFTFANKIEAMHERLLISVKVEPCLTSHLSSALFILPLFYLRGENLHALMCVAKKASMEINLYIIFCFYCLTEIISYTHHFNHGLHWYNNFFVNIPCILFSIFFFFLDGY